MTRLPPAALPVLPSPVLSPVGASGEFVAGRNFKAAGEALSGIGRAFVTGQRATTAGVVGAGKLDEEKFRLTAQLLKEQEIELAGDIATQKGVHDLELGEAQMELVAEHLQTKEAEANLVKQQIDTVKGRDLYDEMRDREEAHILAWLQYANPEDALQAYMSWKFLDPGNQKYIAHALGVKTANAHMVMLNEEHNQAGFTEEFQWRERFDELLTTEMAGVPPEIRGPWAETLQNKINAKLDRRSYREGELEASLRADAATSDADTAADSYIVGNNPDVSGIILGLEGIARSVMLFDDPDKIAAFVEENAAELIYEAFTAAIEAGEKSPLSLFRQLQNPDIPGIGKHALFTKYGKQIAETMELAEVRWESGHDNVLIPKFRFAVAANRFGSAGRIIDNIASEDTQAALRLELKAAKEYITRKDPAMTLMHQIMSGKITPWNSGGTIEVTAGGGIRIRGVMEPNVEYSKEFYTKFVETNKYPHGEYVKMIFMHGGIISPDATNRYRLLLKEGEYAEVGRELAGAFALTPEKTKAWLRGMPGSDGKHLINMMIVNEELDVQSEVWADNLNSVVSEQIGPWIDMAQQLQPSQPPAAVGAKGSFNGLMGKRWEAHYEAAFVKLAKEGQHGLLDTEGKKTVAEQIAKKAAQIASNEMAAKSHSMRIERQGSMGRTMVPATLYMEEWIPQLEQQLEFIREELESDAWWKVDSDVEYQPDKGVPDGTGAIWIPGFSVDGGDTTPVQWYRFQPIGAGAFKGDDFEQARSLFNETLLLPESTFRGFTPEGQQQIRDNILRTDEFREFASLKYKLGIQQGIAGSISDPQMRTQETERLAAMEKRLPQVIYLHGELQRQHSGVDMGKGYIWRFNRGIAGGNLDITVDEYNTAAMAFGKVGTVYDQAKMYTKKYFTQGAWDDMSPEWQSQAINTTLDFLQYPEQFKTKPGDIAGIWAILEAEEGE